VERNPLRANLETRAHNWPWSRLCRRDHGDLQPRAFLSHWPLPQAADWLDNVNPTQASGERTRS
jgi:hypothetical protein